MAACEMCKHWTVNEHRATTANVNQCTKPVMMWDAFAWKDELDDADPSDATEDTRVIRPEFAAQRTFVTDASDYMASFYTRADFSCADFEEKV